MERVPDNVVLSQVAAAALRREFLGWQCRIRQLAAREEGARPSPGMCPRVFAQGGEALSSGIVTLIIENDPLESTALFRYQYLRTQDPNERYDSIVGTLQGRYFQDPDRFSDVMTALFGAESPFVARLLEDGGCVLEFEQYTQCYRIPCAVARLADSHPFHPATLWHNRMFNTHLPPDVTILSFRPDWPHAAAHRREQP
jgi:hypothetical protein